MKSLYESPESFYLIDEDGVVLSSALQIPEPIGFGDIKLTLKRNIEDRGGANFEFGDAESNFGFDHHNDVYDTIQSIIDSKGSDANIRIEYYNNSELRYSAYLIPSSMSEEDDATFFRAKRTDFGDKFRTRQEVEIAIDGNLDLNGVTLFDLEPKEIPLHSKTIFKEGRKNSYNDPQYDHDGFDTTIYNMPGALWGIPGYNNIDKNIDNFYDYGNYIAVYDEVAYADAQDRLVDSNPLYANKFYHYKASFDEEITININHEFRLLLDTDAADNTGTLGTASDAITALNVRMWIVNDGVLIDEVDLYSSGYLGVVFYNNTRNINYSDTISLNQGDEIYYGFHFVFSTTAPTTARFVQFDAAEIEVTEGYFTIESQTRTKPSLCKGYFIYDALNRMLQKAIGSTNIGELRAIFTIISGTFTAGEVVVGQDSGATGKYHSHAGSVINLIDVQGTFIEERIDGTSGAFTTFTSLSPGYIGTYANTETYGRILKSSLLERIENNEDADGCASLNFVTNGFAVRNFLNEDYDGDRYYKKGDKVRYVANGLDYVYINDTVDNGNLPTNATYWTEIEPRKITSSIKKLIDFVKYRYGAGIAIIKEEGTGFGVTADYKITRVMIEKQEEFFADKKIMMLPNVENPVVRKINKDLIFNELEFGFNLYAKENEDESLSGFNTTRNYITPIEKDKKKLSQIADVCTDGYEIERLRRITFSESPEEADERDNDTFIVKCIRVNEDNPIDPSLYDSDKLSITTDVSGGVIEVLGSIINNVSAGDKIAIIIISTPQYYEIDTIVLDYENNKTTITTSDTISLSHSTDDSFFFSDGSEDTLELFIPQRVEGFQNIENTVDPYTEYNIDHTPTSFAVENFNWYGSGLVKKLGAELIQYTTGKNNIFFEKGHDSTDCFPTTSTITENQNFTLTNLRSYNPELFTDMEYEINCNMSIDDFRTLREAMINESSSDINFGYVEFVDNSGTTKQAFPISVEYNPLDLSVKVIAWEKNS